MAWEVFNKSRTILLRTFFFRFIYTLRFETSGTALCGTAGTLTPVFSNEVMTFGIVHPPFMACGEPEQKRVFWVGKCNNRLVEMMVKKNLKRQTQNGTRPPTLDRRICAAKYDQVISREDVPMTESKNILKRY